MIYLTVLFIIFVLIIFLLEIKILKRKYGISLPLLYYPPIRGSINYKNQIDEYLRWLEVFNTAVNKYADDIERGDAMPK